ncbi:MAG: DivIVA domain-containing protein, partial [Acidimicrobiia bacterium]|nr:DivIVA domain-containing protein [Acidimicrobiia bacterium]
MTLTPSDVEQKTFSTALRGYNLDEVDDFLDEIVRTMRDLHRQLDEARSGKAIAEVEVPPAPAAVVPPPPPPAPIDESAVGKALVAAQETADRILQEARTDAERILEEAQIKADSFAETREQRRSEVEQDIARLDSLVERVKAELAVLSLSVGA